MFYFIPCILHREEMTQKIENKKRKKQRRPKLIHRFGKKIGAVVTKKPWTVIIVSTIILVILAAFVPKIQYTYGLLDSFPEDMPSREGFTLIADHYPPGEIAPVHVIVDTDGEDISLKRELEKHPYVADVADPNEGSENKDLKAWEVTLSIDPY